VERAENPHRVRHDRIDDRIRRNDKLAGIRDPTDAAYAWQIPKALGCPKKSCDDIRCRRRIVETDEVPNAVDVF